MKAAFGFLLLFAMSSPSEKSPHRGARRWRSICRTVHLVPVSEEKSSFFTLVAGVISDSAGGALLQRGADCVGKRQLCERFRIHQHVDRLDADDRALVAGDAEFGADRKR